MIKQIKSDQLNEIVSLKMKMFDEVGVRSFLIENVEQTIVDIYSELYAKGWAAHFVVEDKGEIVACAGGIIKNDIPACFLKTPFYGFVIDVYTEPLCRQQGHARRLTEAVLDWLADKGVKTVKLVPSDQAKGLYQSLGFRESGEMVLRI